jgi:hypothetical protein
MIVWIDSARVWEKYESVRKHVRPRSMGQGMQRSPRTQRMAW